MSSNLIVEVCKIKNIVPHDNADKLEISVVKGWNCITKKGQYKKGDIVVFIPPDSILPINLADTLGIRNYLGGSNKDRVRCAKLRGFMSFGLIIDLPEGENWKVGTDVKDYYGITKYEPPIRTYSGDAAVDDPSFGKFTDIENIKNHPDVFKEGEKVVVLEKIDGQNFRNGLSVSPTFLSRHFPKLFSPKMEVKAGSHNLKRKKPQKDKLKDNRYWFPGTQKPVKNLINFLTGLKQWKDIILYGELYGTAKGGMKGMCYGKPNELDYVIFALKLDGKYADWDILKELCDTYNVNMVPVIAVCGFNFDKIKELAEGNSVLAADNGAKHIREGIVILPVKEREDKGIGRVILKLHGDGYLSLKNNKEKKGEVVDFTDE